jgi:hypothetical protein
MVGLINNCVLLRFFGSYPQFYAAVANYFVQILHVPQPSSLPPVYLRPTIRCCCDGKRWLRIFESYFTEDPSSRIHAFQEMQYYQNFSRYTVLAGYLRELITYCWDDS